MEPNYSLRGWAEPKQCYDGSDLNVPFLADFGLMADNDDEAFDVPQIPKTPKNLRGGGLMRCWSMPDVPPPAPLGRRGRPSKAEADERFLLEYRTLETALSRLATGQVLCITGKSPAAIERHVSAARRIAVWHGLTLEWEDKAKPERVTVRVHAEEMWVDVVRVNEGDTAPTRLYAPKVRTYEWRCYAQVVAKRVQSQSEQRTEVT